MFVSAICSALVPALDRFRRGLRRRRSGRADGFLLAGHHFFVVGLACVEVDGGGVDVFVAEQALDHEDGAVFGAVGGESVAQ